MDDICRTCLSPCQQMKNIFKSQLRDKKYFELLNTICEDLKFRENEFEMPQNICANCEDLLRLFFNFGQKCKESDKSLRTPTFSKGTEKPTQKTRNKNNSIETQQNETPSSFSFENEEEPPQYDTIEIEMTQSDQDVEAKEDAQQECEEYLSPDDDDELILNSNPDHVLKQRKNTAQCLCPICGKKFGTRQRLNIHHLTHTGEKNFECETCKKTFATDSRLRSHFRIHTGEKPYKCNIAGCSLTFAQGNALKCHLRTHTGEKPFECKICGKRFSQNTILKTHMTLHIGKTVQCDQCDKKFSRSSYLILHRREHTGEKPYACHACPNRYMQKSHLDRHLGTHLGIKYKCTICSKEYTKSWSLKVHMYSHVAESERPFYCDECKLGFIRKHKYEAHMKLHKQAENRIEVEVFVKEELNHSNELPEMPNMQLNIMSDYGEDISGNNSVSNVPIKQANEITEQVADAHIEYIFIEGDIKNELC